MGEYVQGGCIGPPPPFTNTDDTPGTYLTNYLIGIVAFGGAIALGMSPRATFQFKVFSVNANVWTAFGCVLAGQLHQILHEDNLHQRHRSLWVLSYVTTIVGIMFFGLIGTKLLVFSDFLEKTCSRILDVVIALLGIAISLYQIFGGGSLLISGVYSGIVVLYVFVVCLLARNYVGAVGTALMISGYAVQVILAPTCGDAAYAQCFKDCPLPAPYFNHNALFHVLFAIGIGLLDFALVSDPVTNDEAAKPAGTRAVTTSAQE